MTGASVWRIGVPIGGTALLGLFALLYLDHPAIYFRLLTAWGVVPFRFPFLDTHAVLAAAECARRGLDPYLYDPCDVLSRAQVYSPLFLEAARLPVTVAWTNIAGIALALALILCVASLPPPRRARESAILILAAVSTMTMYAVERGNNDLLIFVLVTLVGHLASRGGTARTIGYVLIMFGACLKYYPLAALIGALRETPRRFAAVAAAALAVLILFAVHYRHGLAEAMALVPSGSYFTDFFGAVNLPFGLAILLAPLTNLFPGAALPLAIWPWAVLGLLILSAARRAIAMLGEGDALAPLGETEMPFLIIGAAVIVGCFFVGQSIDYRGIFFLLLLPGLLALGRPTESGRPHRVTALMILFLMWGELFREALQHVTIGDPMGETALRILRVVFWLARELVWWRVIARLAGLMLCFAARSEIGAVLRNRVTPLRGAAP